MWHLEHLGQIPAVEVLGTVGLWSHCATWENCFSPYRRVVVTIGLLQCDPITLLKSLSWKSRLNVCSSSSGEGSERNVEPWPPCCWLSPVEPKWPLTQSPLLESTATLDLQEKFSFEDLSSWLPSSPARSPSPAVPLRVVPTLSTTDMKTAGENWADSTAVPRHHGVEKWELLREVGTALTPNSSVA